MAQSSRIGIHVVVINASDFVRRDMIEKQGRIEAIVSALQKQVHEHFAPAWGIDAEVTFLCDSGPVTCDTMRQRCNPPQGSWWLVIFDNSDQAGVLGYRDFTPQGLPLAKVFAQTAQQNNRSWTVTASHELLEMLADPGLSLSTFRRTGEGTGQLYAHDVCDPCVTDTYEIDGVRVSNFVYPAWFEWFHDYKWSNMPGIQFDQNERISEPFQLLPGGYISVLDSASPKGWRRIIAEGKYDYYMRASVGSRRERRDEQDGRWPWPPEDDKS